MKQLVAGVMTVLLLTHGPALRAECDGSPAIAYLDVIEAMDWPGMRKLLAPNARYIDPTMIYFDRPAIDLSGPEAIVAFWSGESDGSATRKLEYSYRSCAQTASYHMIHYDVVGTVAGATWNVNRAEIDVAGSVTSIIRIVDGAIVEHRDYVDYESAVAGVDRLREQFGPSEQEAMAR